MTHEQGAFRQSPDIEDVIYICRDSFLVFLSVFFRGVFVVQCKGVFGSRYVLKQKRGSWGELEKHPGVLFSGRPTPPEEGIHCDSTETDLVPSTACITPLVMVNLTVI